MSLIERFLAPYDDQHIVLVERYNLALVAARARRALPQDPTPLNPPHYNETLRTTGSENA
jgi:hypothetical protein